MRRQPRCAPQSVISASSACRAEALREGGWFSLSSFPDSKILSLGRSINKRQMVLVRTDFTDPSQDASATNNQIISWTYHSPFSGFSYFP